MAYNFFVDFNEEWKDVVYVGTNKKKAIKKLLSMDESCDCARYIETWIDGEKKQSEKIK